MGFLDIFKKKTPLSDSNTPNMNLGLNEDPFKSDPMMDTNSGLNLPKDNNDPMAFNDVFAKSNMQQDPLQKYQQQEQPMMHNPNTQNQNTEKDFQIVIAKLDALRAEVQTLNHKIENIEKNQAQRKKMW